MHSNMLSNLGLLVFCVILSVTTVSADTDCRHIGNNFTCEATALTSGQAVKGSVSKNRYSYYKIDPPGGAQALCAVFQVCMDQSDFAPPRLFYWREEEKPSLHCTPEVDTFPLKPTCEWKHGREWCSPINEYNFTTISTAACITPTAIRWPGIDSKPRFIGVEGRTLQTFFGTPRSTYYLLAQYVPVDSPCGDLAGVNLCDAVTKKQVTISRQFALRVSTILSASDFGHGYKFFQGALADQLGLMSESVKVIGSMSEAKGDDISAQNHLDIVFEVSLGAEDCETNCPANCEVCRDVLTCSETDVMGCVEKSIHTLQGRRVSNGAYKVLNVRSCDGQCDVNDLSAMDDDGDDDELEAWEKVLIGTGLAIGCSAVLFCAILYYRHRKEKEALPEETETLLAEPSSDPRED